MKYLHYLHSIRHDLFLICPLPPHLLHPLVKWNARILGTVYVPIILAVATLFVAGLLAQTAFIFVHCPIVRPPRRWWGGKRASRSNPFGCIVLWGHKHIHKWVTGRAGARNSRQKGSGKCRCLLREQLPLSWQRRADRLGWSCRLPLDHCLSRCTLRQVVLMLRAGLWWCSSGAYLYWWERYRSNRNGGRQVDPLQQNTTFLPLQSLIVPLNESRLIYIKQLQSSALHDYTVAQDQLSDLTVVPEN